MGESGCVETDLREDPEALEEFVRHLGLRKFEIRRLVRALHLRAGTKSDLASTAGHRSPSCPHEVSKPLCVGDWKPHHATTTLDSDAGEDCNNRTWADYDVAFKLEGRHDSKRTTASRVEDEKKWAKWIESDSGGIEHGCKLHSVAPSSSNESSGVNSACVADCCTSKIVAVSDRDRNGRKPRSPLRPTSGNEESESVATARPTHGMRPRRSSLRAPPRKKDSGNWPAARKRAESLPSGRRVRIVSPRFQADEKTDSWDASWSISSNVPGVAIYSMSWSWLSSTLFGSADEDQVLPRRTKSADEVVCDELTASVHLL